MIAACCATFVARRNRVAIKGASSLWMASGNSSATLLSFLSHPPLHTCRNERWSPVPCFITHNRPFDLNDVRPKITQDGCAVWPSQLLVAFRVQTRVEINRIRVESEQSQS